jgi:hypothetical protein
MSTNQIDDLYDMSDDDLEAAFKAAKADFSQSNEGDDSSDQEGTDDNDSNGGVIEGTDVDDENSGAEDEDNSSSSVEKDNDGTEQLGNGQDSGPDVGGKAGTEGDDADKDKVVNDDDKSESDDASAKAPTVRKFKANGKDYEITHDEMIEQFPKIFAQAMDYTKKTQAIAPWRKTIDAIEQAKLTHADINLAIDVLKGDKGAIAELLKRTGTDALDLNPAEATYTPNDYGRDSRTLALQDVLDSIKVDPEYSVTGRILSSDWDDASFNALSADPEKVRLLHQDVKSGVYAKVQAIAEKQKVFDGGKRTDLDYYMSAAREYYTILTAQETQRREEATNAQARQQAEADAAQARIAQAKTQDAQRKAASQAGQARKAAAPSASVTKTSGAINYLDASEEDFEEWYKRINNG